MNSKKQIAIVAVVLSSILSMVAPISGLTASEVFGQNATLSTGQQNTTNATSTQAATPSPMADLNQISKN